MKCASVGAADMVEQLLLAGADVNKVATPGWTPLQLAASSKHVDVVKVLLAAGVSYCSYCTLTTVLQYTAHCTLLS